VVAAYQPQYSTNFARNEGTVGDTTVKEASPDFSSALIDYSIDGAFACNRSIASRPPLALSETLPQQLQNVPLGGRRAYRWRTRPTR
jgi:hypothetical protein